MLIGTIAVWVVLCLCVAGWASNKGRNPFLAFVASILLSPLVGFIIVAVLRDKQAAADADARIAKLARDLKPQVDADVRACPRCAEMVKRAAIACRFCGADLPPAPEPQPLYVAPAPKRRSGGRSIASELVLAVLIIIVVTVVMVGISAWGV